MYDRLFKRKIDCEGEPRGEGQQQLVHLELKRVDSAQYPGAAPERLLFQRLVIQPDLKVIPCGELVEILPDTLGRVYGVRRKCRDENGGFVIKAFNLVDGTGADSGYPA